MQRQHDRLLLTGTLVGQQEVETVIVAEFTVRIDQARRPVDADDLPAR